MMIQIKAADGEHLVNFDHVREIQPCNTEDGTLAIIWYANSGYNCLPTIEPYIELKERLLRLKALHL